MKVVIHGELSPQAKKAAYTYLARRINEKIKEMKKKGEI